jgi:hypothetical protein
MPGFEAGFRFKIVFYAPQGSWIILRKDGAEEKQIEHEGENNPQARRD